MCDDHSHDHGDHGHDHGGDDHDHSRDVEAAPGPTRLAVVGKGGVGKSTISAAIARHLSSAGETMAIDADPDMNLATLIGADSPPPITDQRELIEERAGTGGGLVKMTPEVEDVLSSHAAPFGDSGRLITIGAPDAGASGCMCPENSFVRSLVASALDTDYAVLDMEAGVEHLGRGTADSVDAMLVVVEPSQSSIDTAARVEELARDLGIDEVFAVVNKVRGGEADAVTDRLDVPVVETVGYDEDVAAAGLAGESPVDASESLRETAASVVAATEERLGGD